jgi:ABC-2 type transport system ATP-binding protein
MYAVEISHLAKSFGETHAVVDVSFAVERSEIFGLLGPNGAGKTTTIRAMLDVFQPDRGAVSVLGGPMDERKKDRIGYMPEERGLYQDVALERCLTYLATLKGLSRARARRRVGAYLERLDLAAHRARKVGELSKGMQQKAQIVAAIAHGPELLIIDEPFSGLDPVNTQRVKALLHDLRDQGTTILMSTHQMHQVEALCDRILLIDGGRNVLYGALDEIRRRHAGGAILVQAAGSLPSLPGTTRANGGQPHDGAVRLTLHGDTRPQDVLERLVAAQVPIERFEIAVPSLDEIFVRAVAGPQSTARAHGAFSIGRKEERDAQAVDDR